MKNDDDNNNNQGQHHHNKDTALGILDSRFNQTLRNVQGYFFYSPQFLVSSVKLVACIFSSEFHKIKKNGNFRKAHDLENYATRFADLHLLMILIENPLKNLDFFDIKVTSSGG